MTEKIEETESGKDVVIKKTESYSLISFILSISFVIIGLIIMAYLGVPMVYTVSDNLSNEQSVVNAAIILLLIYVLPLIITLILGIVGLRRIKYYKTKGHRLAILSIIISAIFIIIFSSAIYLDAQSQIQSIHRLPSYCAAKYGGSCVPADQCPLASVMVRTECDAQGMVCCPVIGK